MEIFDGCFRKICLVSWKYLLDVLEIFDRSPGDIYGCPGDIFTVSWTYLIGVLDIFDGCSEDI